MPVIDEKTLQDLERVKRLKKLIAGGQLGRDQLETAQSLLEKNPSIGSPIKSRSKEASRSGASNRTRFHCFTRFGRTKADAILAAHGQSI